MVTALNVKFFHEPSMTICKSSCCIPLVGVLKTRWQSWKKFKKSSLQNIDSPSCAVVCHGISQRLFAFQFWFHISYSHISYSSFSILFFFVTLLFSLLNNNWQINKFFYSKIYSKTQSKWKNFPCFLRPCWFSSNESDEQLMHFWLPWTSIVL
jgi:hypothetical protein